MSGETRVLAESSQLLVAATEGDGTRKTLVLYPQAGVLRFRATINGFALPCSTETLTYASQDKAVAANWRRHDTGNPPHCRRVLIAAHLAGATVETDAGDRLMLGFTQPSQLPEYSAGLRRLLNLADQMKPWEEQE